MAAGLAGLVFFALWCLAVTILSSIPGNRFAEMPFSFSDKFVHFVLFATGAFFLTLGLRASTRWSWIPLCLLALVGMFFFGVADEMHQLYTPGRSGGDVGDMIADALGAAFGIGCARLLHGRLSPKTDRRTARPDRAS